MPAVSQPQLSRWKSGIIGLPPGRPCKSESARSSESATPLLEAKRRALSERAERQSGAIGRRPRMHCMCEPARLSANEAPFDAQRRVMPGRSEGRSGAIARPLRKRLALTVKCSLGNTSPDLVQPEHG